MYSSLEDCPSRPRNLNHQPANVLIGCKNLSKVTNADLTPSPNLVLSLSPSLGTVFGDFKLLKSNVFLVLFSLASSFSLPFLEPVDACFLFSSSLFSFVDTGTACCLATALGLVASFFSVSVFLVSALYLSTSSLT